MTAPATPLPQTRKTVTLPGDDRQPSAFGQKARKTAKKARPAALLTLLVAACVSSTNLSARENLGIYSQWGVFRTPSPKSCYAIATPGTISRGGTDKPYVSITNWPARNIRSQVYFRLSRTPLRSASVTVTVGRKSFSLLTRGNNAWPKDAAADAAIVASMRTSRKMTITARTTRGTRFTESYDLEGAASALDAVSLACAR